MKKKMLIPLFFLLFLTSCALVEQRQKDCVHSWVINKEIEQKEPTCSKEGEIGYKCRKCGKWKIEKIDKLPHKEDDGVLHRGTCKENFKIIYTCSICANEREEVFPDTNLHIWDDGVFIDSTEENDCGYTLYTCLVCGNKYKEIVHEIPDYVLDGFKNPSFDLNCGSVYLYECSRCKADLEYYYQNWDDGVVVFEPTDTERGLIKYSCLDCDRIKYEIIKPKNLVK